MMDNLRLLWQHKRWILLVEAIVLAVGIVIVQSIPKQYSAKVKLAPEVAGEGNLGSLMSMTMLSGVELAEAKDAIAAEFYPDVLHSMSFMKDLLGVQIETRDGALKTDLFDYLTFYQKKAWWSWLYDRVVSDKVETIDNQKAGAIVLSVEEFKAIRLLQNNVSCVSNPKTGIISIDVTAQDPLVAALLADSIRMRLQDFITDYRTKKARVDAQHITKLCNQQYLKYEKAQRAYASYCDAHVDALFERNLSKRNELENEMQLQFSIYSALQQQLQLANGRVQECTPIYAVLDPATVPAQHSYPHKPLMLIAFLFIGLVCACAWVLEHDNY